MAADEAVLDRVRALLAKAESTPFEAEAEAFFAKAQDLMTRHQIEEAMLASHKPQGAPTSKTIVVQAPYVNAKSILLNEVARVNYCRVVKTANYLRVYGFESDLAAVEQLFTSLLMHATRSMMNAPSVGRSTKSFRHSFLIAYAVRIGDRLKEAKATAESDHETKTGQSTALVLVDRKSKVDAAFEAAHPHIRTTRVSSTSYDGHVSGRSAADRADLGSSRVGGGTKGALR